MPEIDCRDSARVVKAASEMIRHYDTCGFLALEPGVLPEINLEWVKSMVPTADALQQTACHGCERSAGNSAGRWDMLLPYENPFGSELIGKLHSSVALMSLVRHVLGSDAELSFVSLLVAKPGAADQNWHWEGTIKGSLKVQIPLVDISRDMGMIEVLDPAVWDLSRKEGE